jgi:N6-adenosine-specific RNA methylase IME4
MLKKLEVDFIKANLESENEIELISNTIRNGGRRLSDLALVKAYVFCKFFQENEQEAIREYGTVKIKSNSNPYNLPMKILYPDVDSVSRNRRSVLAGLFSHCAKLNYSEHDFAFNLRINGNILQWKKNLEQPEIQPEPKFKNQRNENNKHEDEDEAEGIEEPLKPNFDSLKKIGKKFQIVVIDPPWRYYGGLKVGDAFQHYNTLSIEDLSTLPVSEIAEEKSVCLVWATSSTMHLVPNLMKNYGFDYCGICFLWIKSSQQGVPYFSKGTRPTYTKPNSEYLLIGSTEKNGLSPWKLFGNEKMSQNIFASPGRHSEKPEIFRTLIQDLFGNKSRIELFSRRKNCQDWENWGDEIPDED